MTPQDDQNPEFRPDRASGLERLRRFVPHAGAEYARTRNYDFGVGNRANVSQLSPWLRHRLITEEEVLAEVLSAHSLNAAEKFVQEVCWRTYWKGWLEMRPQVWSDYVNDVVRQQADLDSDESQRYKAATSGQTGIECFDAWCHELLNTGYMHNHSRMWFASIWIFTLRLPWSLGADFFLRHLLDGDAASNTLSWRWVAGLQTAGKTYLARSSNIAKYTAGRFDSTEGLATEASPVADWTAASAQALPPLREPVSGLNTALLMTDDDLSPSDVLKNLNIAELTLSIDTSKLRSQQQVAGGVTCFVSGALDDAERRATPDVTRLCLAHSSENSAARIVDWCKEHDVQQLVSAYVPVGPSRDALKSIQPRLKQAGVVWNQVMRPWDAQLWPFATKGFFNFKKHLPGVLADRGLIHRNTQSV